MFPASEADPNVVSPGPKPSSCTIPSPLYTPPPLPLLPPAGSGGGVVRVTGSRYMLVNVWSAPNYCYRCGNIASVLTLYPDGSRQAKLFKEVPVSGTPLRDVIPYFL